MRIKLILFTCLIFLSAWKLCLQNQAAPEKIVLYWGSVSNFEVTTQEILKLNRLEIVDTIKHRKISEINKFRFIIQPLLDGPVKVAEANGPELNQLMRDYISSARPGDRILITDIFAFVESQGLRQIPAAAVFEIK